MIPASTIAATVCAAGALLGLLLHGVAVWRLRRHLDGESTPGANVPPVTHWRAIKQGVPELEAKLEALLAAGAPEDQFLFGADADSAAQAVCQRLAERHPDRDISVVPCAPGRAANPKISKFLQMEAHARHPLWLLTDSEALPTRDFMNGFRREWQQCDVLTAGYRLAGLATLPQVLDTAPVLLSLWPGLMHVSQVDFTLGACTAVRAAAVRALGGWAALGGELAEDRQLGRWLAAAGHRVRLSREVLTLEADALTWWDWLRHQHRVAVTYRKAAPRGALGLPLMQVYPCAAAAGCVGGGWGWWLVLAAAFLLRWALAAGSARLLRFRLPWLALSVLIVPWCEFLFWLIAWLPLPVWWAGRWRRLR